MEASQVAEGEGQVCLGVEQERGEVIGQGPVPSALIIDEPRLAKRPSLPTAVEVAVITAPAMMPAMMPAPAPPDMFNAAIVRGRLFFAWRDRRQRMGRARGEDEHSRRGQSGCDERPSIHD